MEMAVMFLWEGSTASTGNALVRCKHWRHSSKEMSADADTEPTALNFRESLVPAFLPAPLRASSWIVAPIQVYFLSSEQSHDNLIQYNFMCILLCNEYVFYIYFVLFKIINVFYEITSVCVYINIIYIMYFKTSFDALLKRINQIQFSGNS